MDTNQELGRASSPATAWSLLSRTLVHREQAPGDVSSGGKGPLGLTTLYDPGTTGKAVVVDIIFVHGLNGGSQSTWSKGKLASKFWPKEWLPKDDAFQNVRFHSFGYSSGLNRQSVLNVRDFAQSLLGAVKDSPVIREDGKSKIIFVAHSMGGLVVKMAYILGHREPEFRPVINRVFSIIFLGTPHQGASIARALSRLITIVGARPFVDDLLPESLMLRSINEDFPQVSGDLHLISFYETRPMSLGGYKTLIVEKTSAVMNLTNERRTPLDADHRHVAMFSSPNDHTYVTVRNALATLVSSQSEVQRLQLQEVAQSEQNILNFMLGIAEAPEDDLITQESRRLPGTCGWLSKKEYYLDWKASLDSRLLWIRGRPGTGKSVLSSYIVEDLREIGADCCFFFFKSSDKARLNASEFLRSMAWQMAMIHRDILSNITRTSTTETTRPVDSVHANTIWKRLYLSNILKVRLSRPQFWVIDSIDECEGSVDVMDIVMRIQESWPVAVLITSRDPAEIHLGKENSRRDIECQEMSEDDVQGDIALLLKSNFKFLPCPASDRWPTPESMASHILARSGGSFLWASLICSELRQVTSEKEIEQVLGSVPSSMDSFYTKILEDMKKSQFGKSIANALITWVAYAFRPLTTSEIQVPVELDTDDNVDNVERVISKCCGNMVYVDDHNNVQLVHATAREFLITRASDSGFTVSSAEGHQRLAKVCMGFLMQTDRGTSRLSRLPSNTESRITRGNSGAISPRGKSLRSQLESRQIRRPSRPQSPSSSESPFTRYASKYVFEHLNRAQSDDKDIIELMSEFFSGSSVLRWIEYNAAHDDLHTVYQAGQILNTILARRAKHSPPLTLAQDQTKVQMLVKWGNDLIHLVTKFARELRASPPAIHHIIPPFCPLESAVRKQFSDPYRGLNVEGVLSTSWDHCPTTITYDPGTKPNVVAAGPGMFAVGMMTINGKIVVYGDSVFQELHTVMHGEPVWRLTLSEHGTMLASSGAKTVRIWSTTDGKQISSFKTSSMCIALQFAEDDTILRAVDRQNQLIEWDVFDHLPLREYPVNWSAGLEERMQFRSPTIVEIGAAIGLMCVIYRGEDIVLWDYLEDRVYDLYQKETGSVAVFGSHKVADGATTVGSVTFSQAPGTGLLAAAYIDGDLVTYDLITGERIASVEDSNIVTVSSSPDGRTLAGADSHGNLTLFEFSTLTVLQRIQFDTQLMPKSIEFTSDSTRIIEIRGDQCRVWEPTVLLRADISEDGDSDTLCGSSELKEILYNAQRKPEITAMACCRSSSAVFYAVSDGSVYGCDISEKPDARLLFELASRCPVHILHFDETSSLLSAADRSGRITVRKVVRRHNQKQPVNWHIEALIDRIKAPGGSSEMLQSVVTSGEHLRMLVSQDETDSLISLKREDQGKPIVQLQREWSQWSEHPTKRDCLIATTSYYIEIHKWEDLSLLGKFEASSYGWFTSLCPLIPAHLFATRSAKKEVLQDTLNISQKGGGHKAINTIQLWGGKDFEIPHEDTKPVCQLEDALSSCIARIIGSFGARLIVYTTDHWIASIELQPPRGVVQREDLVRHFFLPSDWIGGDHERLIFGIGSSGEILFARRSELAVIKRGLETTESGASFNPRRVGTGWNSPLPPRLRGAPPGRSAPSSLNPSISCMGSADTRRPCGDVDT
ncbi:hypothetical protein KVR01_009253 [Diaporthe batatas]|uniref:uncharacterized protein n=1 Tax=Diaporthe batatas TaxID=748121 RepID=UPI001D03683D|nr:uncharacterized protein KVR01_009253 [Diaporthe batatas]KAG8160989.1 hypothetical protein KVR01_009253 [Diaporthe batatas]